MKREILITGATGGLGRAIVKKAMGDKDITHVYCAYRNQEKFAQLFPDIKSNVVFVGNSELQPYEKSKLIKELIENKPNELICIFTSFAIAPIGKVGTFEEDDIISNIRTNIGEMVAMLNHLIRYKNNYETNLRLVNIDSGAAYKAIDGWALYCSAKAYVNMFLKTICLENQKLKAVSYDPGVMDTQMQITIRSCTKDNFTRVEEFREYFKQRLLNRPEDVADDIWQRFVKNSEMDIFETGYHRE